MIKRILYLILTVIILFLVSYSVHEYVLTLKEVNLPYSLLSIYIFHVIATIIIYVSLEFLADNLPNEAGYGYLAFMLLKIGFFLLIFQDTVFGEEKLVKLEKVSLVIPLFIFLATEAIVVSKLLNNK
ncbi:hypothetical protein BA195_02755 [Tenacibaculum soleae]|uniref:Uncharacterized protein n=1 Tax=Tenacibaculum soleae TaxID=447689 RepID=A0A1B9Y1H7_9FLAO|nr:DUF6168 family protein [Tenacibaculum soleae]MDO6743391.1 DUF6168 family protein [Tenacibaculum soleae]OCK43640.1 hypothetical protein BA195_02755 [Tenacibaculum soleae]